MHRNWRKPVYVRIATAESRDSSKIRYGSCFKIIRKRSNICENAGKHSESPNFKEPKIPETFSQLRKQWRIIDAVAANFSFMIFLFLSLRCLSWLKTHLIAVVLLWGLFILPFVRLFVHAFVRLSVSPFVHLSIRPKKHPKSEELEPQLSQTQKAKRKCPNKSSGSSWRDRQ